MNTSISEYKVFIKKHFPHSNAINNTSIDLIYCRVCENNIVTEIYEKYITIGNCEHNISCYLEFLQNYRRQFNNLLLYLPLNEQNGINFCMRAAIENLLKFLCSIYTEDSLESITTRKFRHIRECLNNVNTELYINKDLINTLTNYYGKFSNSIHDKNFDDKSQLEYMESIIESNKLNLVELDDKLLSILNNYEVLISNIFKISKETLSIADSMRLKNTLNPKRFEKIKQHLHQECR